MKQIEQYRIANIISLIEEFIKNSTDPLLFLKQISLQVAAISPRKNSICLRYPTIPWKTLSTLHLIIKQEEKSFLPSANIISQDFNQLVADEFKLLNESLKNKTDFISHNLATSLEKTSIIGAYFLRRFYIMNAISRIKTLHQHYNKNSTPSLDLCLSSLEVIPIFERLAEATHPTEVLNFNLVTSIEYLPEIASIIHKIRTIFQHPEKVNKINQIKLIKLKQTPNKFSDNIFKEVFDDMLLIVIKLETLIIAMESELKKSEHDIFTGIKTLTNQSIIKFHFEYIKSRDKKTNSLWWQDFGLKAIPKLCRFLTNIHHDLAEDSSEDKEKLAIVLRSKLIPPQANDAKKNELLNKISETNTRINILNTTLYDNTRNELESKIMNQPKFLASIEHHISEIEKSINEYFNDDVNDHRPLKAGFEKTLTEQELDDMLNNYISLRNVRNDIQHHPGKTEPKVLLNTVLSLVKNITKYTIKAESFIKGSISNTSNVLDDQTIFSLVKDGDINILKAYLDKNPAAVNYKDRFGDSCIFSSITEQQYPITEVLVAYGTDLNHINQKRRTPLHTAAFARNVDTIKLLLRHNANPEARDKWGETAYDIALLTRHQELIQCLSAATINSQVDAIHSAIVEGNIKRLQQLIQEKYNINLFNAKGSIPLITAIKRGNFEAAKILLKAGANVNVPDSLGDLPLHEACKMTFINSPLLNSYYQLVIMLIEHGADINSINYQGETPVHCAIRARNFELLHLLVNDYHAAVTVKDKLGCDAVLACFSIYSISDLELFSFLKVLHEAGANLDTTDHKAYPLQNSILSEMTGTVIILLEFGVNPYIKNYLAENAFELAQRIQNPSIINALQQWKEKQTKSRIAKLKDKAKTIVIAKMKQPDPHIDALCEEAQELENSGKLELALEKYEEANQHTSDLVVQSAIVANQAIILDDTGRSQQALDLFQKSVSLDPFYADAHYLYAMQLWKLDKGSYRRDIVLHFETAVCLKPEDKEILKKYSIVLLELGEAYKSIEVCNHLLLLQYKVVDVLIIIANCYYYLGNDEKHYEYSIKAQQISPTSYLKIFSTIEQNNGIAKPPYQFNKISSNNSPFKFFSSASSSLGLNAQMSQLNLDDSKNDERKLNVTSR